MERHHTDRNSLDNKDFTTFLDLTSDQALQEAVVALNEGNTDVEELAEVFAQIAETHNVTPDELNAAVQILLEAQQYGNEA